MIEISLVLLAISQIITLLALRKVIKTTDFYLKFAKLQNELNSKFIDSVENTGNFMDSLVKFFEGKK